MLPWTLAKDDVWVSTETQLVDEETFIRWEREAVPDEWIDMEVWREVCIRMESNISYKSIKDTNIQ